MRILVVSTVNYGPENGDGIKKILFNIFLRNTIWNIDMISFYDLKNDIRLGNVKNFFVNSKRNYCFNYLKKPWARRFIYIENIKVKMIELLNSKEYDFIFFVPGILADLIEILPKKYKDRAILLAVDSMSMLWERKARKKSLYASIVPKLQKKLWINFEGEYYTQFKKVIFVSSIDKKYYIDNFKVYNAVSIENGVDIGKFVFKENNFMNNGLIFTGNMFYQPNIEAVEFLMKDIFKKILKDMPDLKLYIVGKGASTLECRYDNFSNVKFVDYIDDMAKALELAKIYISPLLHGAGIKNKILEAMAVGKLIVASDISFDGIVGINRDTVYIANSADEYIEGIKKYLGYSNEKANQIGYQLSNLIKEKYSWEIAAQKYNDLLIEMMNSEIGERI